MDNDNWIRANIPGASQLADWFEYWPLFHDAEVTELQLARSGTSWLKVHAWHTTNETISSHFITHKHVYGRIVARQMEIEFLPWKPVDRDST